MKFLAIGECMVELRQASADDATLLKSGFAGDTVNTAWYLAQLQPDWDMYYLTDVGTDRLSNRMVSFIEASGLRTEFVVRRDDATVGMYLIEVDQAGERSFLYWRNQSAARHLADDPMRLESALRQADAVYLSGITLAILPPDGRVRLLAALSGLDPTKTTVVFDPNLRPKLWEGPETMRSAVTQAASLSSIVLPSFEDEAAAFGDASPMATIARYRDAGAMEVVVKDGGSTIQAIASSGRFEHRPPRTKIRDSTAAGDSFNAGYLSARLDGLSVPQALAAGSSVASQVVSKPGALVDLALR